MSQNSSASSTPPSTATPGEPTAAIDPSNNINGPKQHANKVCRCACVCQEICRSDDYYCDPCIAAKHNYLPPGLDNCLEILITEDRGSELSYDGSDAIESSMY
ncbi:integral membrane protein [Fusarium phyllophilum]|uniref:Integral membrane protein n=1 Tax=Fusarium phyllophilum TaxID=47803 RepID=A0A8H5NI28_9HYPO|nr:integral membrane protein [Fusarium phyllophilum]